MNARNLPYKRIVSLVPSLTELLIDLDLTESIAGRTRFCIHPEDIVRNIPIIGGTKNPNLDKIRSLNPDLIIANKEENRAEDIFELQNETEVCLTDISTIDEALETILNLGRKLGAGSGSEVLVHQIRQKLSETSFEKTIRTAYFIWRNPWMSIGHDTYIHDVMKNWGLENIFGNEIRYPEIDMKQLEDYQPGLILLSSEPFPFKEKHQKELKMIFPDIPVLLVNGEWFSWYGSKMVTAFDELNRWRRRL